MSDLHSTQPLPDPAAQWVPATAEPPRRRRRAWPWVVAVVVVVALAIAAWFAGEWIARDLVTTSIRQKVITSLALPADQAVDVTLGGMVLPQLIGGGLDDVTVASQNVTLGQLTGDVSVHAKGVRFGNPPSAASATATVSLGAAQLQALLSSAKTAVPLDAVELAAPNVTAATSLSILGLSVPVAISLTPSAANGQVVLTPVSLQVAGAQLTAADVRSRFGGVADSLLQTRTVCVAQYIPVGMTLTSVAVQQNRLVADLAVDPGILSDPALQAKGTCA